MQKTIQIYIFTENIRHPTASYKNFFRFEPVISN